MTTTAPSKFVVELNALAEGVREVLRAKGHRFASTHDVLAPPPSEVLTEFWAQEICSTYIHELHHRWQFQRWGLVKYILRAIPVIRQATLERTAKAIELQADRLLGTEKE